MKVIDLLVKIANGEEVPKKIIYKNELYILKEWENLKERDYYCESTGNVLGDIYLTILNDEVEIIEDTPKEDKKIKKINEKEAIDKIFTYEKGSNLYSLSLYVQHNIIGKLNEIIDKVNKGEENE